MEGALRTAATVGAAERRRTVGAPMILALTLAACVVAMVAWAAFRRGRGRDARRLPPALGRELRAHKLECLGEPQERVDLELRLLLGDGQLTREESIIDSARTAAPRS